ncbi:MAG: FAD-binding oxidoreductase [Deltaproteobacteria bacterium]|nr:FAD-binding oxidoreductase [Deltaproteobacteria bacterium]
MPRSFWGWGIEEARPTPEQGAAMAKSLAARFGRALDGPRPFPTREALRLRAPRVAAPSALRALLSDVPAERAGHHYGKSFRDIVRGFRGEFPEPPDFVAFPNNEADVAALLDWCGSAGIAAIPYGGGSSVVGGVETNLPAYRGVLSLDLSRMGRVLEVDRTSRAARIQAGAYGPALEDQLRPHRLTLRHFPQSFEFSTLGGWIATRGGGHYASLYTHIDDFVESLRVVTPRGVLESRRLPGSGAGPSPDRMFIGSEGILGVITEAWMRVQDRPTFRAGASVLFRGDDGFFRAAEAVRAISQAGLYPANCRLLDAQEALGSGAGDGTHSVLVLGFESADHALEPWMKRALELCRAHGGEFDESKATTRETAGDSGGGDRDGAAGAWRNAFLRAPYARDAMAPYAVIMETFETAIPWNRFRDFHARVMTATRDAVARVCGAGTVSCRFTHVYPDGPAPYYSISAPSRHGSELAQWGEIKAAASEALIAAGGTITHHHAVGRDHRPWYDQQRPELFASALRAAKKALDPHAVLNPGVLIDPA